MFFFNVFTLLHLGVTGLWDIMGRVIFIADKKGVIVNLEKVYTNILSNSYWYRVPLPTCSYREWVSSGFWIYFWYGQFCFCNRSWWSQINFTREIEKGVGANMVKPLEYFKTLNGIASFSSLLKCSQANLLKLIFIMTAQTRDHSYSSSLDSLKQVYILL